MTHSKQINWSKPPISPEKRLLKLGSCPAVLRQSMAAQFGRTAWPTREAHSALQTPLAPL